MARNIQLPPSAASLSASMRDIGYSLETAIADLIDNSISANATNVDIFCDLENSEPTLVVVDNGNGIDQIEILAAMRHGSSSPKLKRNPSDLGRFGLGLKTASFSQCKRLTVVSAISGVLSSAEWDLDLIDETDDWTLNIPDVDELINIPFIENLSENGTIVIWRSLDRLFEDEFGKKRDEIVYEKLDVVGKHLALVFHRFLSGETKRSNKLTININGHKIEAFDPFCRKNSATQVLPKERVQIFGQDVVIQPYILPHHSKLTAAEYDYYENRSNFLSNQGAYIYRNRRLIAWGDWFRIIPKGESTKLARVKIDFPSSLDESWTIDIKKSRAKPPPAVRERMRQVIERIVVRSTRVHIGRGAKIYESTDVPIWDRFADRGCIRYSINCEHPFIGSIKAKLEKDDHKSLSLLFQTISSSLPVEMIYSDYSTHPIDMQQNLSFSALDNSALTNLLHELKKILPENSAGDPKKFMQLIRSTRMFENCGNIVEEFILQEFK